jgi:hypothetical protein
MECLGNYHVMKVHIIVRIRYYGQLGGGTKQ